MVNNPFADILGPEFACKADPPFPDCPCFTEGPALNQDTGQYTCVACLSVVGGDTEQNVELFDDDEEDDMAMGSSTEYIPEGDKIQDWSPDHSKRIDRERHLTELTDLLVDLDRPLAIYLAEHPTEIIDELRRLEEAGHEMFKEGKAIKPKLIAVASHFRQIPPSRDALLALKMKPSTIYNMVKVLDQLNKPHLDAGLDMEFHTVGRVLNIPKLIVKQAIDDWETQRPVTREPNKRARVVAWLFVVARKAGSGITKKEALALTGVKRNSFNRAIKSYEDHFSNLNGAKVSQSADDL